MADKWITVQEYAKLKNREATSIYRSIKRGTLEDEVDESKKPVLIKVTIPDSEPEAPEREPVQEPEAAADDRLALRYCALDMMPLQDRISDLERDNKRMEAEIERLKKINDSLLELNARYQNKLLDSLDSHSGSTAREPDHEPVYEPVHDQKEPNHEPVENRTEPPKAPDESTERAPAEDRPAPSEAPGTDTTAPMAATVPAAGTAEPVPEATIRPAAPEKLTWSQRWKAFFTGRL